MVLCRDELHCRVGGRDTLQGCLSPPPPSSKKPAELEMMHPAACYPHMYGQVPEPSLCLASKGKNNRADTRVTKLP